MKIRLLPRCRGRIRGYGKLDDRFAEITLSSNCLRLQHVNIVTLVGKGHGQRRNEDTTASVDGLGT